MVFTVPDSGKFKAWFLIESCLVRWEFNFCRAFYTRLRRDKIQTIKFQIVSLYMFFMSEGVVKYRAAPSTTQRGWRDGLNKQTGSCLTLKGNSKPTELRTGKSKVLQCVELTMIDR